MGRAEHSNRDVLHDRQLDIVQNYGAGVVKKTGQN